MKPPRMIRQEWLADYRDKILRRDSLVSELKSIKEALEARSAQLCAYANAGVSIEKGDLTGKVKTVKGRRVPAYKEWIVQKHGEKVVEEILEATVPGEDKEEFEVLKALG